MKSTRNIFFFTLFLVLSCQTKKMEKESQNEDATSSKQTDFSAEDYTLKVKNLLLDSIENESFKLRKQLKSDEEYEKVIQFTIDTFKINQYTKRKMIYFYTTNGMNMVVNEETHRYDSLMNVYYFKLKNELSTKDQQILKIAQLSWLNYRDKELDLIGLLRDEKYSGGGTIQSNLFTGMHNSLVIQRTIELFEHYSGVEKY
jgi:uncharacterized protein YecT (DUF1311 family)